MAKKKPAPQPRDYSIDDLLAEGVQYRPRAEEAPEPAEQAPDEPKGRTLLSTAKDAGVSLLKGAIGVPEAAVGLADLVSGGRAGKLAEEAGFRPKDAKAMLDQGYSPEQQAAFKKVQAAEGLGDTFFEAVSNSSVIPHAVLESLPSMGAGGVVGRGVVAAAPKVAGWAAGALGEGVVGAGAAAEQIRQQTPDGYLTGQQAGLGALTGVATTAFGALGGKISKRLGIADVDTMMVGAAANPALKKGIVRSALEGAFSEGILEELPQSVSEQVLQNVALGKPIDEGIDQAIVMGALTGGAMGAGVNVMNSFKGEPPPPAPVVPPSGPLSRAANLALPAPVITVTPTGDALTAADRSYQIQPRGNMAESGLMGMGSNSDVIDVESRDVPDVPPVPKNEPAAPRAERRNTDALELDLPTDPVENYIEDMRAVNTPAAKLYVRDFDKGSITAADVAERMAAEREKTPDERIERAAAEAPTETIRPGDLLNPKGQPFKTKFPATRTAKEKGGTVIAVPGGYAVRQQSNEDASVQDDAPRTDNAPAPVKAPASQAPAPASDTRRAEILKSQDGLMGTTRAANLNYMIERAEQALQGQLKHPFPNKASQDETVADWKQKISDYQAILPAAEQADRADQRKDIDRSMLQGAKSEIDAAVANGEMTQAQASAAIEDARKTGNAADATEAIFSKVDQAAPLAAAGLPAAAQASTGQAPDKNSASTGPAPTKEGASTVKAPGNIKAITAKQIPDMTDDEIRQAITHYGPDHKRTAKLQTALDKRTTTTNPGATNEPQADQAQPQQTQQQGTGASVSDAANTDAENDSGSARPGPEGVRGGTSTPVSDTNDQWQRTPTADREGMAVRAGITPLVAQNIAKRPWKQITATTRGKLLAVMQGAAPSTPANAIAPVDNAADSTDKPVNSVDKPAAAPVNGNFTTTADEQRAEARAAEKKRSQPATNGRASAWAANPFKAFIGKHGINLSIVREYAPGPTEQQAAMVQGFGPIFRKNGLLLDELAERAVQDGFILDEADTEKLDDLIKRMLKGEKIIPVYAEGAAENEMEARIRKLKEAYDDQMASEMDDAIDAIAPLSDNEFDFLDDNIPFGENDSSNVSTESAMRSMGFTEDEIQDAIAQESRGAQTNGTGDRGTDEAPASPAQEADGERAPAPQDAEGLTAPTAAEVVAAQDRTEKAERAAKAKKKADDELARRERERRDIAKASENAADSFTLGGDAEQNLSGQGGMFDDPAPAPKTGKSEGVTTNDTPPPAPKTDELAEKERAAKTQMLNAAAKLAALLGKNTRMNIVPEQEQAMLPIVIELFDGAMQLGYVKFRQAARYVREFLANAIDQDAADSIPIDTLQGAYIATARMHKDKATTPKGEVVTIDSIEDLAEPAGSETIEETRENADTAPKDQPNGTTTDNPGVGNRDTGKVPSPESGRNPDSQPNPAPADSGNVEEGQPGNVGEPVTPNADGPAGLRAPRANVDPQAGTDGSGLSGDGRTGASGAGNPDAGAGNGTRGRRPGRGPKAGPGADAGSVKDPESVSPANTGPGDFVIDDPLKIVGGGQVARFEKNKAAIEMRNTLSDAGRTPTKEEQAVLAGYTGWGSFGQELFKGQWGKPEPKAGWEARDTWLRENLGQKEWEGLQASIINAHFTDPPTVMAMWDMVRKMGFTGGRTLEPSIGIGNFYGLMPVDMTARSQRAGIELDPVTGSMAQMLYPSANIQIKGYEESTTPDNFYDLIIGNWPFFEHGPADRKYNRLNPTLHDYFFLKAIDQTRPGGLVVGITSKGTMDKKGLSARIEMARKAELVAAFRLPTGAFAEYAGTNVVTDIIILRKREAPIGIVANEGWIETKDHATKEGTSVSVNEYFHKHPTHVIGEIDYGHGTTSFRPGMIVHRPDNMMEQLKRIVNLVPSDVFTADQNVKQIAYVANHTSDRTNSLIDTPQGLFVVRGEYLAPANEVQKYALKSEKATQKREAELKSLIQLRKLYGALIDAEHSGTPEEARTALREAYEAFGKDHGQLSKSFGLTYLERLDDPFYPSIAALELSSKDAEGKVTYRPAAILTASTMRGAKSMENPSITDAFVLARNSSVNPSLEEIAKASNTTKEEVREQLLGSGAGFELPNGDFSPSDIYLAGNVRNKMRDAQAGLANGNEGMAKNIEALKKVMPKDVPYYKIETQMGATWVPASTYGEFVAHMLGLPDNKAITVGFQSGSWKIDFPSALNHRAEAASGFGSANVNFKRLVRAAIANQTINVKRKDSDGNEYIDQEDTKEVNGKIADMRLKFGEWLWSNPTRRATLEAEYNEVRNAFATPKFDGSFLGFQGMALSLGRGPFQLREHQVNAIWRAIVMRKSLNAHEVGTGKTFTMGGIAVESRRYGIAKKPMLFAHNANSKSVAAEIQMMYPSSKVLYVDNMSKENVKTRMMQIANDDWDVIVLPHSLIDSIGFKEKTLMDMAQEELADLYRAAEEAAAEDDVTISEEMWDDEDELKKLRSATAKQLVKQRLKILATIRKLAQQSSKDGAVAFEDLGVDMLLVDEAHEFKKPPIATKMNMKGLQTSTSDRSIAMMFLSKYVRSQNNGANVHLFTGTPITNTMTEVFHMMRYMMQEEMKDASLADWDGWFGSFAREVDDVELTSTGEYEAVTRLQSFINVPELRRMIGQYMDVVFSDDMPEMQPRQINGKTMSSKDLTEAERGQLLNGRTENAQDRPYKKVINESSDMSPEQNEVYARVQQYANQWRNMEKKDRKQAMIHGLPQSPIIHEGIATKASFDVRLVDAIENAGKEGSAEMTPHPDSKPARTIKNLIELYNGNPQAGQVVFMSMGMAKSVSRREGAPGQKRSVTYPAFSTMHDMIERLVAEGIPREQIAAVDGSTSKDKRKEIADKMNTGEIRIVFGSTGSLGVGVNMQRNLRAMHHMDAPWMPGDLEQRNGRGHRQGNQWNTVREYRYITDRLDGKRWQTLARKQRFITDFMKSKGDARVIEGDEGGENDSDILGSFAEAAGDPRVLIREKLKKKLEQLQSRERLHALAQADAEREVGGAARDIAHFTKQLEALKETDTMGQAGAMLDAQRGDGFRMVIEGKQYAARSEAIDALKKFVSTSVRINDEKEVGTYGGKKLMIEWPNFMATPTIYIKLNGTTFEGADASINSLDYALRDHRDNADKRIKASIERGIERRNHASAVATEPFHMQDKLNQTAKQLADLQADIDRNPVAPPYWLRNGAPVDTEVVSHGVTYVVTGHRWNDSGWYVLAQDDKGDTAIPYMDAMDAQGMNLYDEREFSSPTVGTNAKGDTAKPEKAPKVVNVLVESSSNLKQTGTPEANNADVVFSRSRQDAPGASTAQQDKAVASVQKHAEALAAGWENAPKMVVAYDMQDERIPARVRQEDQKQRSQGATGTPEGFYYAGTVYVMASQVSSLKDTARVLFHETLGHAGLRGNYGKALNPILTQIVTMRRAEVSAKAKQYGLNMANEGDRLTAAEEVLAEMAQTKPELGFVQRAIAAIRTWLRANVKALEGLKLTDAEIVRSYILPARRFIEGGSNGPRGGTRPAMSRRADQTDTPAFKSWFGKSKVVDAGGNAQPVYRGHQTGTGRNAFTFYTDNSDVASTYSNKFADVAYEVRHRSGDVQRFDTRAEALAYKAGNGGTIAKVANAPTMSKDFLSLQNPLVIDAQGAQWNQLKNPFAKPADLAAHAKEIAAIKKDIRLNGQIYTAEQQKIDINQNYYFRILADTNRLAELAKQAGHDGLIVKNVYDVGVDMAFNESMKSTVYAAFRPEQIKSATGNNGDFDPQNPDAVFSRSKDLAGALAGAMNNARDVKLPAGYVVGDFFSKTTTPGTLNWWHKTVGTAYNTAQRFPKFKVVYDAVQDFLNDVSRFATEAADLAPSILPKLDNWKDIAKTALSPADNKAIAAPIFEGTLTWGRDDAGRPVKMAVLEAKAAKLDTAQKAQELLRKDKISESLLKMWQGMPVEQYETMVESRYESEFLKAGTVFTDAELKGLFQLNDKQIGLYKEFRAAIDKSLTTLALSDMVRYGGTDIAPIKEMVMEAKSVQDAAETLRDYLMSLSTGAGKSRASVLIDMANKMVEKSDKARDLMKRGYAPLSRFGTYSLDVVDTKGERVYFGLFESAAEAAKMARQMAADYPGAAINQGTTSQEAYKLFAGVSPETLELFGEMLGLESEGDDAASQAFQEYLKLARSSRSAMKRLIQRKGIAGFNEDPGRVLAGFVYSNARQTSGGLHMGDISKGVADIPKGQGELQDAAAKLADYIKNPQEEAQKVRGLLFAQYLGGSVASAMVNMTQPLTVTYPYLSQYGGTIKAAARMKNAIADVMKASTGNKELDDALKLAEEQGIVAPQEVHQLMAQASGSGSLKSGDGTRLGDAAALAGNTMAKLGLVWGKLFSSAEQFNRRVTFIAAYRTAKEQGIANPAQFAAETIAQTQFTYNKGSKPRWARGAVGGTLFTFKQYSVNYVELVHRMATQGGPEGKKAAALMMAVLFLIGGAGGLPFAEDAEDIADGIAQRLGYNWSTKQRRNEFVAEYLGKGAARFIDNGLSGLPGVPIDLSGRMGMGNLIPATGLFTKKQDYSRDILEIVGPAGDLAKRALQSANALAAGEVVGAGKFLLPVAGRNFAQFLDMANTGMYRDQSGKKVIDVTGYDALAKAIGFQPNAVAQVQDGNRMAQNLIAQNKMKEAELADRWAVGLFEAKPEKVQKVRDEIRQWNIDNPNAPIRIELSQVFKRVKAMRSTKAERLQKTAPKEIRETVRRELTE